MQQFLDLDRYPLNDLSCSAGKELLKHCQTELKEKGRFSLDRFLRSNAVDHCLREIEPILNSSVFTHSREHNIYFDDCIDEVEPSHPALKRVNTINHTICGDQLAFTLLTKIYEWQPLVEFLSAAVGKSRLFQMKDPLARLNVMAYYEGEALNWHFDRAEFTTTLLLAAPQSGGDFQVARNLRNDLDPNFDGVAALLNGDYKSVKKILMRPGDLCVFRGRNSAHRITPVKGHKARIIAVFSYSETEKYLFSKEERESFYGRSQPIDF